MKYNHSFLGLLFLLGLALQMMIGWQNRLYYRSRLSCRYECLGWLMFCLDSQVTYQKDWRGYTQSAQWITFRPEYSEDYLLEPTDPLFVKLGNMFYDILISQYGTDHVYNADTYNEMEPSSTDLNFLKAAIYIMESLTPMLRTWCKGGCFEMDVSILLFVKVWH